MAEAMRALTVRQPFAWAIAYGGKDVENRPRPLSYRGPVAIHAGLAMHAGHFPTRGGALGVIAAAQALDALGGRGNCWEARVLSIGGGPRHPGLALGAVIAVAELAGCHHAVECREFGDWPDCRMCSPWAVNDQYHLQLTASQPLREPVPCDGKLGLWRLPEDVEKAVREQLSEPASPPGA